MPPHKFWLPDPAWKGRTAVVIATGPSLSLRQCRSIALARMEDRCRVIAVNDAVFLNWWADICFSADGKWWMARHWIPGFAGLKVQVDVSEPHARPDMQVVKRVSAHGYDARPGHICTHKNSGSMAAQMAAQAADKVVLVGFDMRQVGDQRHFFGDYDGKLNTTPDIENWIKDFRVLHNALPGKLFNATKDSALDFVPPVDLETVLR